MATHGVSPKVLIPTLVSVGVGAILLIIGVAVHDASLKAAGAGVLLAAAGHGAIGYVAPSGPVSIDAVPQDSPAVVGADPVPVPVERRKATRAPAKRP